MNKEACQVQESKRRHNYREDLDLEKFDWLFLALSQLEMVLRGKPNFRFLFHTMALTKKTAEAHASGNREALIDDDRWKANWWTTS